MSFYFKSIMQSRIGISVPMFHHLVRLSVSTSYSGTEGLLELLYAAPFLKFLKICVVMFTDIPYTTFLILLLVKSLLARGNFYIYYSQLEMDFSMAG